MGVLDSYDITQYMDLNDDERRFLNVYRRSPQELRDVLDKFMDGTPQEREEAGKIVHGIIEDLRAGESDTETVLKKWLSL